MEKLLNLRPNWTGIKFDSMGLIILEPTIYLVQLDHISISLSASSLFCQENGRNCFRVLAPNSNVPAFNWPCDLLVSDRAQYGPAASVSAQHESERSSPVFGLPPEGHGGDPELATTVCQEWQRGDELQCGQYHLEFFCHQRGQLVEFHLRGERQREAVGQYGIFGGKLEKCIG